MNLRTLTWRDFDWAVDRLCDHARDVGAESVCGVPRGGLPLAVAVSHHASLRLVQRVGLDSTSDNPLGRRFVIDDIADSGRTVKHWRSFGGGLFAVWVRRSTCREEVWSVLTEDTDAWLVFPWEDAEKVAADFLAYKERHRDGAPAG